MDQLYGTTESESGFRSSWRVGNTIARLEFQVYDRTIELVLANTSNAAAAAAARTHESPNGGEGTHDITARACVADTTNGVAPIAATEDEDTCCMLLPPSPAVTRWDNCPELIMFSH